MQNRILKHAEQFLFYGSLLLCLGFIVKGGYNPSIDGPTHMYNARIIGYLFSDNDFIHQFFSLNKVPVPNLASHFILAFFYIFFSSTVSVKLLLIISVAGLALAFRAILSLLNPSNICFSVFGIVLAHSFLYYIGFYNFCLSLAFMLWATYYYLKYVKGVGYNSKRYAILFVLIMFTYFTNGLAFAILGFMLGFVEIQAVYVSYKNRRDRNGKAAIKRFFIFSSLWIPGIICFLIFSSLIPLHASNGKAMSFIDLVKWIINVRPLIVYGEGEELLTKTIFYVLIASLLSCTVFYFKEKENAKSIKGFVFLTTAVLILICYFAVPNGSSVGMMSVRFCFYFFLFFILWLALQRNYSVVIKLGAVVVYALFWILMLGYHQPTLKKLNNTVTEIVDAGKLIKPNSVVFAINYTDNWLMDHFTDYALLQQPEIDPNNYEAMVGWFPVVWSDQTKPHVYLNDSIMNMTNNTKHPIDYIFVLGDISKMLNGGENPRARKLIDNKGTLVFKTNDSLIHLYSINNTAQ